MKIKQGLIAIDALLNHSILARRAEKPSLVILAFHSLLPPSLDEHSLSSDPYVNHGISDAVLRMCIDYFYYKGYTFVSPDGILDGLRPDKRYIMITFDDGYANTRRVLPVLREFKVPAVFFIATDNVRLNRGFWWDVLWRRRRDQGFGARRILREQEMLKPRKAEEIESYIAGLFGIGAFTPCGDHDRPFTPDELSAFSRQEYVHIGNHTRCHSLSCAYTAGQLRCQLSSAQEYLTQLTGRAPVIFAYPDGACSPEAVRAVRESGIPLAVTLGWRKNYLPLDAGHDGLLRLARFVLNGTGDIVAQCALFRADVSVYGMLKRLVRPRG